MTAPVHDFTVAGLAHTLVGTPREDTPTVLIRTPYGRLNHLAEAKSWAGRGFPCVVGDVRGRHDSDGNFRPYRDETEDGATVLDHLERAGHHRIIAVGASYAAHCAVTAAIARPGLVAGVLAAVPALGLGETAREPGGAARLACRVGWWNDHIAPVRADLRHLPVAGIREDWGELWDAPERNSTIWDQVGDLTMPLLAVGGLSDPFAADTERLTAAWGGATRLVIGPWGHELDASAPGAALAGRRIGSLYLAWARALSGLSGHKRVVAVAVDGWRRWAPRLTEVPLTLRRAEFDADPDAPFRSLPLGVPVETGPSAVLTAELPAGELRGSARISLDVVADAPDADWVVRLSCHGVQQAHAVRRVRHRPGEPCTVTLDLPPIGCVCSGEVRFEVAGHHWPRHARNPHTGEDAVRATRLFPSHRTVLGGTAALPWFPRGTDSVSAAGLIEEIAS